MKVDRHYHQPYHHGDGGDDGDDDEDDLELV